MPNKILESCRSIAKHEMSNQCKNEKGRSENMFQPVRQFLANKISLFEYVFLQRCIVAKFSGQPETRSLNLEVDFLIPIEIFLRYLLQMLAFKCWFVSTKKLWSSKKCMAHDTALYSFYIQCIVQSFALWMVRLSGQPPFDRHSFLIQQINRKVLGWIAFTNGINRNRFGNEMKWIPDLNTVICIDHMYLHHRNVWPFVIQ